MTKVKIRNKPRHAGTLEENIKNVVVANNGILKRKNKNNKKKEKNEKNKVMRKRKRKSNNVLKILHLANKQNKEDYSNFDEVDDCVNEEEQSQEADKFLEFDDDMDEEILDDISFSEGGSEHNTGEQQYPFNLKDEQPNDILEDLNIEINNKVSEDSAEKHKIKGNADLPEQEKKIDSLVEKCYKTIGEELSHYKTGKLHQALTILVKSPRWFELLMLTKPKKWTNQATFEVTKLFSSGLKEKEVAVYYEFILLPILLEYIERNKKLDSILYKTVIKALYKSKAWFKGILYPLLQRECTKKQIIIFGSVIQKMSVSINAVTYGLNEIFTFPWNAGISYILSIFLNKKYAFSKEFIDKCVDYFVKFQNSPDCLTINWHKSLLLLVKNYRALIDDTQTEKLRHLIKRKNHHQISSEILKLMYSPTFLIDKLKNLSMSKEENIV
ncbi:essential nuclear protein 1, putative [Plasmodium ovale]|uniref:Essential nuclear protein 1, putative n=2 Tax=Plasmodium ovale TaxID=36330 RepID=A0A1C3KS53_PLAOA|nr:essential nuclear protein 1, putative [Plasmodium ovale]